MGIFGSVANVLDAWSIIVQRRERVNPLQMWHVVECINATPPTPNPSNRASEVRE